MFVCYVVPIIESISVEALSLTLLSVNIVLLTDGGQMVDSYAVRLQYLATSPSLSHIDVYVCFRLS